MNRKRRQKKLTVRFVDGVKSLMIRQFLGHHSVYSVEAKNPGAQRSLRRSRRCLLDPDWRNRTAMAVLFSESVIKVVDQRRAYGAKGPTIGKTAGEIAEERGLLFQCPECDGTDIEIRVVDDLLRYGVGVDAVDLPVTIPVHRCTLCGFEFTSQAAHDIQHAAVERHRAAQGGVGP